MLFSAVAVETLVMAGGPARMVKTAELAALWPFRLVAVKLTVNEPVCVGVPETRPVIVLRVSPGGKLVAPYSRIGALVAASAYTSGAAKTPVGAVGSCRTGTAVGSGSAVIARLSKTMKLSPGKRCALVRFQTKSKSPTSSPVVVSTAKAESTVRSIPLMRAVHRFVVKLKVPRIV